jgi:SAM-dependent methyltransferase
MPAPTPEPEFDRFAKDYDHALARSLAGSLTGSLTGAADEGERFAEYKVGEMALQLSRIPPRRILDFGCGVGRSLKFLERYFPGAAICGYDPSPASLDEAHRRVPSASLFPDRASLPAAAFDAVLAANVLHHIAPDQRPAAIELCGDVLARGGSLFVFEHNPFNPVTRRVFDRCPFDEGASMLPRRDVIALGRRAGLKVRRSAYTLFLPFSNRRWLRAQRLLSWLPAGAQYYVQFEK